MPRKVTKVWKQKDGKKIRICDMTDKHLVNSLNLVERQILDYRLQSIWDVAHCYIRVDFAHKDDLKQGNDALVRISELLTEIPAAGTGAKFYDSLLKEYNRRGLSCLIGPRG